MKLYLVAGEASGDARGAELMRALRQRIPEVEFCGAGGHEMRALAGGAFLDWHIALAEAAAGSGAALEARLRAIEAMARDGRYPSGPVVPILARGFAAFQRQDFSAAIDILAPVLAERDRAVGSLAQTDLFEFTLLRAYIAAGRTDEVRHLLATRRTGPGPIRVAGVR